MTLKLHAPGPSGTAPLCSRQLTPHRASQAWDQARMSLAQSAEAFSALGKAKRCSHCARALGFLPALSREATASPATHKFLAALVDGYGWSEQEESEE